MDLNVTSTRNKWAVKTRHMGDIPALIDLNDRDTIDSWSFLRVCKAIGENGEDNNTAEYDAPVPVMVFSPSHNEEPDRPDDDDVAEQQKGKYPDW